MTKDQEPEEASRMKTICISGLERVIVTEESIDPMMLVCDTLPGPKETEPEGD